jgi:hypothetical protein
VAASMRTAVAIASGMLVLGAGLGVASVASADTPAAPNPTSTPLVPTPSVPSPGVEPTELPSNPEQAAREAELIKVLSEMFGVEEAEIRAALDELRAAYQAEGGPAALDAYLEEAVRSGILTQEEADVIRQAVEQALSGSGTQ